MNKKWVLLMSATKTLFKHFKICNYFLKKLNISISNVLTTHFFINTYYLQSLKSVSGTLVNISLSKIVPQFSNSYTIDARECYPKSYPNFCRTKTPIELHIVSSNIYSNTCFIHNSSQIPSAITLYFSSTIDQSTTLYFLFLQAIRFSHNNVQWLEGNLLLA